MIPRPYIVVESGADPSSITNSELAYLNTIAHENKDSICMAGRERFSKEIKYMTCGSDFPQLMWAS
jgi:hypothetical protein